MDNKTVESTLSHSMQACELPENVFVYDAEEVEALLEEKDNLIAAQQQNIVELETQAVCFAHNAAVRFGAILDLKTENNILQNEAKTRQEQYEEVRKAALVWKKSLWLQKLRGHDNKNKDHEKTRTNEIALQVAHQMRTLK
tara:strand:- start:392 stop:814 length:423 start_codon:yes stop_codon:yes gene_type:complete